jgi:hypothetical protein
MTTEQFTIKQGALRPSLRVTVTQAGVAVDLTAATAVLRMLNRATGAVKVNNVSASVVSPATGGVLQYDWTGTDTDTPGTYDAYFRVTLPGAVLLVAPSRGSITVVVEA